MDNTLNNEHNNCDEILLSAYLDGEVTAEERHAVEDHIVHCASCAELVVRMRYVDNALRTTVAPRHLHAQVQRSIARESSQSGLRRALAWGGIAAALLASFGLGVWASGGFNEPVPMHITKAIEPVPIDVTPKNPESLATPIASEPKTNETEAAAPPTTESIESEPTPTVESVKEADNAPRPAPAPKPIEPQPKEEKRATVKGDTAIQRPESQPKNSPSADRERLANQSINTVKVKKERVEENTVIMEPPLELPPKIAVSSASEAISSGPDEPIKIELPPPYFGGTPLSYFNEHLEEKNFKPRDPFMAPKGTRVVSRGKKVTSSDPDPTFGKLSMITDGEKGYQQENLVELGTGPQWVQIDLGELCAVYAVIIWHFHAADRVYFDVIVRTGWDPEMEPSNTYLNNDYDNSSALGIGKDKEYIESSEGRLVDCRGDVVRYIRCYSNGNTTDQTNHYIEIEVWGIPIERAND